MTFFHVYRQEPWQIHLCCIFILLVLIILFTCVLGTNRDNEKIQNRITLCNTFCVCLVDPFLSLAPVGHSRSGRMSAHSVFRLKLCIWARVRWFYDINFQYSGGNAPCANLKLDIMKSYVYHHHIFFTLRDAPKFCCGKMYHCTVMFLFLNTLLPWHASLRHPHQIHITSEYRYVRVRNGWRSFGRFAVRDENIYDEL